VNIEKEYPYRPEFFVNRAAELDQAKELVRNCQTDEGAPRTLIYTGTRGAGKTWLALRLARSTFEKEPLVLPFLISLLPLPAGGEPRGSEWWPDQVDEDLRDMDPVLNALITKIAAFLKIAPLSKANLEERSRYLALQVGQLPREKVFLLILDSAFETPDQAVKQLEEYILKPLLKSRRCAVIVTGRGAEPLWLSYEMRDADKQNLDAFDHDNTKKMLEPMDGKFKESAEEIFNYSGGYPLTIRLLAQSNADNLLQALDQAIDQLLAVVADKERRNAIRDYVECLSVLRTAFRDTEVINLLSPEPEKPISLEKVREIRNLLTTNNLMEWDRKQGGFVINPSITIPTRAYLRYAQIQRWDEYIERAYQNYIKLAEKFKREKQRDAQEYYELAARNVTASGQS
jgi:hypothetical protein